MLGLPKRCGNGEPALASLCCRSHFVKDIMAESSLTLTTEEREFLVSLLEITLKKTLIEEHRTRGPTYREHVLHNEELIASLLEKLGQPAG